MLRHGYLRCPLPWREINEQHFKGIWIVHDQTRKPDVVLYYCHGGGFSMGSSYFYMEFLLAWVTMLKMAGFSNPALFALEYTLVPDAVYPKQVQETYSGYQHVLSIVEDRSKICVAGDSAGATLTLSLLLYLSNTELKDQLPGLACMISPWVSIISEKNRNTRSDYLDATSLRHYGFQYIGTKVPYDDPMVSPGNCKDATRWASASPSKGWFFLFGSEEVLGPETHDLIDVMRKAEQTVDVHEEKGGIHAWPVALLYLGESKAERLHGLGNIVGVMARRMI
jgi:acetyl esterase/lipase